MRTQTGEDKREREDRLAGGDDGALLAGPGEDDAVAGRDQVAVRQAALGLDQRGVLGGQLGRAGVDVFLARADLGQPQGLFGVVRAVPWFRRAPLWPGRNSRG